MTSPDQVIEPEERLTGEQPQVAEPSLGDLFGRVMHSARTFAEAELEVARAIVLTKFRAVQTSAIALVVAILLCLAAFVSLLVGLIMALSPIIGVISATLTVGLATLALAVLVALIALARLRSALSTSLEDETMGPVEGYDE